IFIPQPRIGARRSGGDSGRRRRRDDDPRRRLLARLAQQGRANGMLDQLPELLAVGDPAQKADGDAKSTLVAPPAAIRAALFIRTERLLEPRCRVDTGRVRAQAPFDVLVANDTIDDASIDVLASN